MTNASMRVLVIGSGAREHALCWAIARSPLLAKLWCAPGNPGIAQVSECVSIGAMDIPALVAFARREKIDLVVPGPEGPLVAGISDAMAAAGIRCCGPTREAAKLESSKLFGKQICEVVGIPTAPWRCFDDAGLAKDYIREHARIVIKADGLAAGKGVVVPESEEEALAAIDMMMTERVYGDAGNKIIIEQRLTGEEFSFFALCDGVHAIPFGVAQDHKRLNDGDIGPNTGGMGAYAPPNFSDAQQAWVMQTIVLPSLAEMAQRGTPYRGILFVGLMLTTDGLKLIEFNVRFGDPECQALMLRLRSDLLGTLRACCEEGLLHTVKPVWDATSIAVVLAAPGYPETPEYGSRIGLEQVNGIPDVQVFHAGTELVKGHLQAAGGRVLTVCGVGDAANVRPMVYSAIERIDWPEACFRHDIGWRLSSK